MGLDKDLLKIYELFENPYEKYGDHQAYFAIHTLNRLYLELDKSKDSKEIREIVKPFLSDFTIHPYLMLANLSDDKANEITDIIFKDVSTNLFPGKNFTEDIIRRVEYPSIDFPFMKNLLNTMTRKRRQSEERFNDPKKARELFLLYADKQHLGMTLDELESYAKSYHRANDSGRESDDE